MNIYMHIHSFYIIIVFFQYRLVVSGCTSAHSVVVNEEGKAMTFGILFAILFFLNKIFVIFNVLYKFYF